MNDDDILDIYAKLKHPKKSKEIREAMSKSFEHSCPKGMTPEEFGKEIEKGLDARFANHYQDFIKEGAPFTGEDIRRWKKSELAAKEGGRHRNKRTVEYMNIAAEAFLKIDKKGGTTAEAINEALGDIDKKFSGARPEKAVKKWLKRILFFTDIKQSPTGRPKNQDFK